MEDKEYLVLSSSSNGYQLYDLGDGSISLHPHRGKITFSDEKIIIGDHVQLDEQGFISKICPRNNFLKRPRLSNVDSVFVIVSCVQPDFSSYLLDKFLSLINYSKIKASVVLTKFDLVKGTKKQKALVERLNSYQEIGYEVYFVNAHDKDAFDFPKLREDIKGKTVAFVGQTGVGKSSLLNSIDDNFSRKVDSLYVNSGRGRHTTKEVILLPYENGFLFDTPGFSALELTELKRIDLATCFPGYDKYIGKCYFTDCLHVPTSKGCSVLDDIGRTLNEESYENYLRISEEVKENEKWKKKL